MKDKRLVF